MDSANVVQQKILNVAQKQMIKLGYRKVSMDEIAQELKMSKNTIYKEFVSKEEIAKALIKRLQQRINEGLGSIERTEQDPLKVFSNSILLLRKELAPWFEHFFRDIQHELPHLWEDFLRHRNEKILDIQAQVKRGIKKGVFRNVNDSIAVQAYLGSIKAIISPKFLEQEKIGFHEAMDAVLDIWANGIVKRKGDK